mmetsp:Transcript_17249/g.25775  ORF Transcript_17249/g.25775 Transcript_17249/m.25775 type:complete len:480 (+) Transcript_17249:81-1520(+)
MAQTVQLEGWLEKLGHVNKNWNKRYFVLSKNQLEYYADDTKQNLKGAHTIERTSKVTSENIAGRSNCFTLHAPGVRKGIFGKSNDSVTIQAATGTESQKWIQALTDNIDILNGKSIKKAVPTPSSPVATVAPVGKLFPPVDTQEDKTVPQPVPQTAAAPEAASNVSAPPTHVPEPEAAAPVGESTSEVVENTSAGDSDEHKDMPDTVATESGADTAQANSESEPSETPAPAVEPPSETVVESPPVVEYNAEPELPPAPQFSPPPPPTEESAPSTEEVPVEETVTVEEQEAMVSPEATTTVEDKTELTTVISVEDPVQPSEQPAEAVVEPDSSSEAPIVSTDATAAVEKVDNVEADSQQKSDDFSVAYTGAWLLKREGDGGIYHNRFIWIDVADNTLHWSKVDDKEAPSKLILLAGCTVSDIKRAAKQRRASIIGTSDTVGFSFTVFTQDESMPNIGLKVTSEADAEGWKRVIEELAAST